MRGHGVKIDGGGHAKISEGGGEIGKRKMGKVSGCG